MSGGAEVDASQVVQFVLDGNFEGVKTLIEAYGVDVDSTDDDGTTPLMAAAFAGNQKIFSYLLLQGAHVNAVQHAFNWTPLHCACSVEGGAPRMVTDLLQHGAYVNPIDCEGATPLDRLVETGVLTLVPTLRRAGGLTGAELQSSAAAGAAAAARGGAGKSTTTSGGYAAPHSTPVRQPATGGAPPTPGSSLRERIMMSPGFGKARKTVVSQATAATAPPPSNIPPPSASRRTSRRSTTRAATTTSNTSPVYADPSTVYADSAPSSSALAYEDPPVRGRASTKSAATAAAPSTAAARQPLQAGTTGAAKAQPAVLTAAGVGKAQPGAAVSSVPAGRPSAVTAVAKPLASDKAPAGMVAAAAAAAGSGATRLSSAGAAGTQTSAPAPVPAPAGRGQYGWPAPVSAPAPPPAPAPAPAPSSGSPPAPGALVDKPASRGAAMRRRSVTKGQRTNDPAPAPMLAAAPTPLPLRYAASAAARAAEASSAAAAAAAGVPNSAENANGEGGGNRRAGDAAAVKMVTRGTQTIQSGPQVDGSPVQAWLMIIVIFLLIAVLNRWLGSRS